MKIPSIDKDVGSNLVVDPFLVSILVGGGMAVALGVSFVAIMRPKGIVIIKGLLLPLAVDDAGG